MSVRAVERRDAVAPPELAGDRPVVDVLHPVEIGRFPALRNDLDCSLAHDIDCRLGEWFDLHEPLAGDHRLYDRVASAVHTDAVRVVFRAAQETCSAELGKDFLARLEAIEAGKVAPRRIGHFSALVDDLQLRKMIAQARFVIVLVMRWRDFHDTRAEFRVDEDGVANDRNLAIGDRQNGLPSDEIAIAFVARMNSEGSIAEHCLRPCRCHC